MTDPLGPLPGAPTRRAALAVMALAAVLALSVLAIALVGDDDPGTGPPATPDDGGAAEVGGDDAAEDGAVEDGAVEGEPSVGDPYTPDSGATGYDALDYDVALAYDPDTGAVDGTTTMTAEATEDLRAFSFDLHVLEVDAVRVDGEPAEAEGDGRDVRVEPVEALASGEEFTVEIEYSGVPEPVLSAGFPTGWLTTDDGGAYVIGQPDGASTWFPGNDHPSDKATLDLEITVPEGWTVAGNGDFGGRREGDGEVTWAWAEDDPIATYLVVVAIDRFRVVEEETDDGLPLISFYPEGEADELEEVFADAEAMIEAFEELFGPYPFDEYGAIVVPESLGLALETQTRSIFGIDVAGIEEFRSHELAHQWFGDSVTPERWEDIWLNEGFATYGEMLWAEASDEGYDIDADAQARRDYMAGSDEEPILDPGPDRMFSEAVYVRGGLVLHALRRTIGDDDFFAVLQQWAADFRHGNATTDDFIALAEDLSGDDLDEFFEDWLEADEVPELPS